MFWSTFAHKRAVAPPALKDLASISLGCIPRVAWPTVVRPRRMRVVLEEFA